MIMTEQDVIACVEGLTHAELRLTIERGWIRPATSPEGECFSEIDIARLEFIRHLREDMAANEEAVPIVLSLLDQLHGVRHALKAVTAAVDSQEENVRHAVRDAINQALEDKV